jgi:hypothetical protein
MKIQNFDKPTEIKEMYLHLYFFENIKKNTILHYAQILVHAVIILFCFGIFLSCVHHLELVEALPLKTVCSSITSSSISCWRCYKNNN